MNAKSKVMGIVIDILDNLRGFCRLGERSWKLYSRTTSEVFKRALHFKTFFWWICEKCFSERIK